MVEPTSFPSVSGAPIIFDDDGDGEDEDDERLDKAVPIIKELPLALFAKPLAPFPLPAARGDEDEGDAGEMGEGEEESAKGARERGYFGTVFGRGLWDRRCDVV